MQRLWIFLHRIMPPAKFLDRIAPIGAVLVTLMAGFWSLFQYSDQLTIDRVKTGLGMHSQYRETFGAGGMQAALPGKLKDLVVRQQLVSVQCNFLVEAGLMVFPSVGCDGIDPQSFADLIKEMPPLDAVQRATLRVRIEAVQAATVWAPDEELQLNALLGFYQAVAVCVDQNACDPQTTLALFRREIIPFLNAVCGKLALDSVNKADAINIARMIRDVDGATAPYWTNDLKRSQQFLCDWLREPEAR